MDCKTNLSIVSRPTDGIESLPGISAFKLGCSGNLRRTFIFSSRNGNALMTLKRTELS